MQHGFGHVDTNSTTSGFICAWAMFPWTLQVVDCDFDIDYALIIC